MMQMIHMSGERMNRSIIAVCLVAVCAASLSAAPKKAAKHDVSIDDMKFTPDNLTIIVGDSVEWTNNDDRDHTVIAKDGSFKSDNLGGGSTYQYTFKKAGKFPYGCSLHPRMKASVTVNAE
jgi:plastocyanin